MIEQPEEAVVEVPRHYDVTLEELRSVVRDRKPEILDDLGGWAGIVRSLVSDVNKGVLTETIEKRREQFASNVIPPRPPKSFFSLWINAFDDATLLILIVASIISIAVSFIPREIEEEFDWVEGVAILGAVLIVTTVTAVNDFSNEKQFRALNAAKEARDVRVVRDGEHMDVSIFDLVVGDIVLLSTGEAIPADGVLVTAPSNTVMKVDESGMTGESDHVKKHRDINPYLIATSTIQTGTDNRMIVTAVGEHTEYGQIMATFRTEAEETPLQVKLNKMAVLVGKIGTGAAVVTILALIVQWIFSFGDDRTFEAAAFLDWIDYMILGITIIVVAVPEGLPLAVTISLAYSVGKMMEDNNLVRKLAACETMGGATNICSDKTGTLTENRMTVVKLLAGGCIHEEAPTETQPNGLSAELSDAIVLGGVLNSNARLTAAKEGSDMPEVVGSKTEGALLILAHRLGYGIQAVKDTLKVGDVENAAVSADYDFSSDRKRMSRCVNLAKANFEGVIKTDVAAGETGERLYSKGASEIVLGRCTSQLESDGSVIEMGEESRTLIAETIDSFARQSLRTIVLAYRDLPTSIVDGTSADNTPLMADSEVVESDLVFVCLVGIKDPVRAAVPDAIRQCQRAGITVRMITGDNIVTGVAIAKECGILPADADMDLCCIEGPRFRELTDAQVDEILPTLRVMARSSPTDKYRLVKRLRHHGEVVGVTGDGSNDGPALKEADVGLSMGIAGTEVAKEASDIVILDDNFASIVRAVVWGRSVLANIRKFLQFQLTVNVVALIITFIGAVTDGESPLNAVQLLYVNLIMDSLGALALATEEPNDEILQYKPVGRNIPLLTPCMLRNIAVQSIYQLTVLLVLLYLGADIFDLVEPAVTDTVAYEEFSWHLHTIVYNAFIFCQIANEFNTRRIGNEQDIFAGLLRAHLFILVIIFSVAMQWIIVTFGGVLTKTVPLNASEWFYTVLIGVASIPIGFIVKLFIKLPREFEDPTIKSKAQKAVVAEEMV